MSYSDGSVPLAAVAGVIPIAVAVGRALMILAVLAMPVLAIKLPTQTGKPVLNSVLPKPSMGYKNA